MSATGLPMGDPRPNALAPDPARASAELLEAYADATRIGASAALVRRFQVAVTEERAAETGLRGRIRSLPSRLGVGTAARVVPVRRTPLLPAVRLGLQAQGLALLLLAVLSLGILAGGAGAAIVSLLQGPHRGSDAPAQLILPDPSSPAVVPDPTLAPDPTATPAPTIRVRPLAQRDPVRPHKAQRADAARRRATDAWVTPACVDDGGPHVSHRSCAF